MSDYSSTFTEGTGDTIDASDFSTEFDAIAIASATKLDKDSDTATNLTIGSGFLGGSVIDGGAKTTNAGTSYQFTNLPSWVKKYTVLIHQIETTGTTTRNFALTIGTGGSPATTGYDGMAGEIHFDDTSTGSNNVSQNIDFGSARSAHTDLSSGAIELFNIDGNKWIATGIITVMDGVNSFITYVGSEITLAGSLDVIEFKINGSGATFNGGTFNIQYTG